MTQKKLKIGILGIRGFAGYELLRILSAHPQTAITALGARVEKETSLSEIYPGFSSSQEIPSVLPEKDFSALEMDFAFLALPHTASAAKVPELMEKKIRVLDLSADFRFQNADTYEKVYKVKHPHPDLLPQAVYGLTEWNRDKLQNCKIAAIPGCYPTCASLPLIPLLKSELLDTHSIRIDAKSGTSGAGKSISEALHFSNRNENFCAYKISEHRHAPEIDNTLSSFSGKTVLIEFTPHLLPLTRGILSTIYADTAAGVSMDKIHKVLHQTYDKEAFIHITEQAPDLKSVRYGNHCRIFVKGDRRGKGIILVSVLDNMVKGAAGQAIQCMNVMAGIPETTGLLSLGNLL